jgi:hypothetical protein
MKDDRSGEFAGVLAFFIALCTLLVGLRCYTKIVIVKAFLWDDFFSVLTLVCFHLLPSPLHSILLTTGDRYPTSCSARWLSQVFNMALEKRDISSLT